MEFNILSSKFFSEATFENFTLEELVYFVNYMGPDFDSKKKILKVMQKMYLKNEEERIKNYDVQTMGNNLLWQQQQGMSLSLEKVYKTLENQYLEFLTATSKISYPKFVNKEIEAALIERKCSVEEKFLTKQSRELLNAMAEMLGLENYLSLNKKTLCRALTDVNLLAKSRANASLTKCFQGFEQLEKWKFDQNDLKGEKRRKNKELQKEYERLKKDMNELNDLLNQWDEVQFYSQYEFCSNKNDDGLCLDIFENLHDFADRVERQSAMCNRKIAKIKREYKINNLQEGAGFFSRLKANYF
jgi:hypothetical protein